MKKEIKITKEWFIRLKEIVASLEFTDKKYRIEELKGYVSSLDDFFEDKEEINNNSEKLKILWHCRFHPTAYWHEVGCPHQSWTKEELQEGLIAKKKLEAMNLK